MYSKYLSLYPWISAAFTPHQRSFYFFSVDIGYFRDSQLLKMQKITDCGVGALHLQLIHLQCELYIYFFPLYIKFRKYWRRGNEWEDWKNQTSRISAASIFWAWNGWCTQEIISVWWSKQDTNQHADRDQMNFIWLHSWINKYWQLTVAEGAEWVFPKEFSLSRLYNLKW